jgi:hypothetical protein
MFARLAQQMIDRPPQIDAGPPIRVFDFDIHTHNPLMGVYANNHGMSGNLICATMGYMGCLQYCSHTTLLSAHPANPLLQIQP